jgi:CubicO group peptidase (beta-lactamase class C family)
LEDPGAAPGNLSASAGSEGNRIGHLTGANVIRYLSVFALPLLAMAAIALPNEIPRIERAIEAQTAAGAFAGAVLIARDGRVLLNRGYGKASLEWGIANSPATRYRLGSVTKQFTAASVLRLAEQGKLRVEDPISQYLPEVPQAWQPITFFHLANIEAPVARDMALKILELEQHQPTVLIGKLHPHPAAR